MYIEAKLGPIGAKGHVSLDTLIRTEPKVHFIASISGEFHLTVGGDDLATLNVDVLLEGPGRWHARAHASISLFFFSISGTLDLEWGTEAILDLGPPVDVAQVVHDALATDAAWTHVLPAADAGTVQLRSGADALHPLGLLRLTQTAAPLDVPLAKFGANAVSSADSVTVAITATGGVVTTAQELFATSQFFDMSDEDRLSKPAFLPFDAGATVQGATWQVSDPLTAGVVYEESLGEQDGSTEPKTFRALDAVVFGWLQLGAAGRVRPSFGKPLAAKIAVNSTQLLCGERHDRSDRFDRRGVGDDRVDATVRRHDCGRRLRTQEGQLMAGAQFTFASLVHRGFLADQNATTEVTVAVPGKEAITRQVPMMTPGDVIGIPSRQVIRCTPANGLV